MQFLGLSLADDVPDATTVWLFRQQIRSAGLIEELFEQFEIYLQSHGYQAKGGQMLDATIVPVPKQHRAQGGEEAIRPRRDPPRLAGESPSLVSERDGCELD